MPFASLLAAAGLLAASLAGVSPARAEQAPAQAARENGARERARPNFIVIVADDLGWADIGWHESDTETPHLNALAAAGMRLEQHYVYAMCSPTRAALLTGRNPSRFGILGAIGGRSTQHIPLDEPTLPRLLAENGYSTHLSGKWHLGLRVEVGPRKYGYQTAYGYLHGQIDPYTHIYKNGDRTWHRNEEFLEEEGHATDLITDDAVRFVRESAEKPFYLQVAYSVPHFPLNEPREWREKYAGKIADPWRAHNAASITHMDHGVGRIVAAVKELGLTERTVVLFLSDNGAQRSWSGGKSEYEGRYEPHTTLGNNLPLRGWKTQLYDGGIRVPAAIAWPGTIPAGGELAAATHSLDWFPTFAELAGCREIPAGREGRSLAAALTGGSEPPAERFFYWRTSGGMAVRQGDWKLILANNGAAELFNMAADPYEKRDLAAEQPERVAELRKLAEEERRRDG